MKNLSQSVFEKKLSRETAEIMAVMTGDSIDRIYRAVDEVINQYHYCEVCDARTVLPKGHPHCGTCESSLMLRECDECGLHFCSTPHASSDCFRWHACAQVDGPNVYDVTRG